MTGRESRFVDGWRVVVRHEPVRGPQHADRERRLTPLERARRDRLVRPADRDAYTAAHGLVRECAADLLGVPAGVLSLAQSCATCGGAGHGAPSLVGHPDVAVSLSHTDGYVAAIAATRVAARTGATTGHAVPRVGIDVERVRDVPAAALSPRERRWVAGRPDAATAAVGLWVRKETLVKAGVLTLDGLARCDVLADPPGDGPAATVRGHAVRGFSGDGVVGAWSLPPA